MGRPTKDEHEKRSEVVRLRLTLAELEHVRSQAEAAGTSVSDYLRRRAVGYQVPTGGPKRTVDPAVVSELNRIGVNVNQLARATHTGREFVTYWKAIGAELTGILERLVRQQEA